jgi:daunorubicin resistance ABC transporter ATP-binding subunit
MDEPIIELDEVTKMFRGGIRALDRLSLRVPAGIVYGLLGPNGAGKTTLIRVLATLLPFESGRASVAGWNVRRDPAAVRACIGLAGQYAAVDAYLTGRENVHMVGLLYGLTSRAVRRRTGEVLDRMGLTDVADRPVRMYSGGLRRRLDLAASLVGQPHVVFLDEPTTGLDPASRRELWRLIRELAGAGTTVLMTTQYLEEADRLADRVAVIDRGRIIREGTTEELKDRLGRTVVELGIPAGDRARALAALAATSVKDGAQLTVPAPNGARSLHEVLHHLERAGVTPDQVSLRKPTLDEVFLNLTGHPAGAS